MPTYTTIANVEDLLPDSLPPSITTAMKNQWIADASSIVDGMAGPQFPMLSSNQKFPDITDSPATPAWIELCARWLGAHFGFLKLRELNKSGAKGGKSQSQSYYDLAEKALKRIRASDVDVFDANGANLASAEQIYSTTTKRDPAFSRGEYQDGTLVGSSGTLDDFGLS